MHIMQKRTVTEKIDPSQVEVGEVEIGPFVPAAPPPARLSEVLTSCTFRTRQR